MECVLVNSVRVSLGPEALIQARKFVFSETYAILEKVVEHLYSFSCSHESFFYPPHSRSHHLASGVLDMILSFRLEEMGKALSS